MSENNLSKSVFETKITVVLLAISCSVAWAFAFPLIKIGISDFQIPPDDTAAKTLFAGIRFFAAGIVVLLIAKCMKMRLKISGAKNILIVLLFGLVNTALHYFFYYIGLSNQTGSRSAIIDSMSSFILIIAACACFKEEKLTLRKLTGCLLGFSGILLVNIGGDISSGFTFMGDGMLILSAVFSAMGGLLTRIAGTKANPLVVTGISLAFGGGLMIAAAFAMGGRLSVWTLHGVFVLVCLTAISVYGFSIYNRLLCSNPVGEIAIFNSLIPILGVILSCLILGEP
ncbi:MAG: DMT family transporter, partial [Clostridia bacterium]|nr:DMT family transporter [Clostridia bacterium]